MPSSDLQRLQAAATRRHHLVLARELPAFGITRARIRRLRAEGWLVPVRSGVLLVGGGAPSEWQRAVAALAVAGPTAVLSHGTAARVHRLACARPDGAGSVPPDITVVRPSHPELSDCRVHRVFRLTSADVVAHRGVRVTSPLRTLVDLAPTLPAVLLDRTIDEGLIAGAWRQEELTCLTGACWGRAGAVALRRALQPRVDHAAGETPLEERAVRALRSLGPFETQHQIVLDGRVSILDVAWPALRVGVECDGWSIRSRSRGKFDHDRRRNNRLVSHGWTIIHLTSAMSDDEMRAAVFKVLLRAAAG